MKVLLLLVAAISVAADQQPLPCQSPPQWEGRIYQSDQSKQWTVFAKVNYDETNRRVRIVEEVDEGSMKDFYDVLSLYNVNKEYRVDLKTKKCTVGTLTVPFRHFGLPPDFVGNAVVEPVNIADEQVITFDGKRTEGGDEVEFYGAVSLPDCVPVSMGYYSDSKGFVHTSFYDITAGIPDSSVFDPPKDCTPTPP